MVRQRLEKIFFDSIADSTAYKKATDSAVETAELNLARR